MRLGWALVIVLSCASSLGGAAADAASTITPGLPSNDVPALYIATSRLGTTHLLRIPLDGVNRPETMAELAMPLENRESWDTGIWSVSPDGRYAIHLSWSVPGADVFDLTSGTVRRVADGIRFDTANWRPVWSADGTRVATWSQGLVVIDIQDGRLTRRAEEPGQEVRGFDANGDIVLATASHTGDTRTWTFDRWDPAHPDLPPSPIPLGQAGVVESAGDRFSAPLRSILEEGSNDEGWHGLGLRSLETGAFTPVEGLPADNDEGLLDATGRIVVVATTERDRSGDHRASRLWVGPAGAAVHAIYRDDEYIAMREVRFTPDGGLLALRPRYDSRMVLVHENASGRTIFVPLPTDVATADLVRVVGSQPLPPLPIARPAPKVPPEETSAGRVVARAPLVVSERTDRSLRGDIGFSVALGRPAAGGIVRTLDSRVFPVPADAERAPMPSGVIPGPGPDTVTVWTGWASQRRVWIWRLGQRPRRLAVPASFRTSTDLRWSPDGRSLVGDVRERHTSSRFLQVWRPATASRRLLLIPGRFRGGWIERWSADSARILVHAGVCTDYCTPPMPRGFLAMPVDGGRAIRVRPGAGWYRWVAKGHRFELRNDWRPKMRVKVRVSGDLRLINLTAADARTVWSLGTRRDDRVVARYTRPWVHPRQRPHVSVVPDEVSSVNRVEAGWLLLSGEGTLACPPREGVMDPDGHELHWVAGCRSIAFLMPPPSPRYPRAQ